jgi:Coenzyme PQQ synthesis protein D (PqqD)
MNFFERRRFLKKANLLDLTPVRLHEHEEEEKDKVVILVKKFKNVRFSYFALGRHSPVIRIRLDEIGSEVWKAMDGVSDVATMLDRLNTLWHDLPEKTNGLEKRLTGFLSIMYDNRYISFREIESRK